MNEKIKILELFGGIGAPRCALRNLGIPLKSIDYVEIDEKAVRSYNQMFADDMAYKTQDVRGWDLKPDILIHGSPCQDFSIAGKQAGADEGSGTRSSLMWETINIIKSMGDWKPKVILWENVPNVLSRFMRKNFDRYILEMKKLGYMSTYATLNAMDFGLPQSRERVFTVSILGGKAFDFSKCERKQMRSLDEFLETDVLDEKYIVSQPSMLCRIGREENRKFKGCVPIIQDYAYTITTKQMRCPNSGVIDLQNGKYRYLTELECWRLMGFTDDDYYRALEANHGKKNCLNSALYKQAGNSMPVPVLESIFEQLLRDRIIM